jgi:hypothetical protein
MKIWAAFLLLSFVVGIHTYRRRRAERVLVLLVICVLVAVALSTRRWA